LALAAAAAGAGEESFFRNSSFLLAFLLTVEGLSFFRASVLAEEVFSLVVSREKVKPEPTTREKLKDTPWEAKCRQKSRHLEARGESTIMASAMAARSLAGPETAGLAGALAQAVAWPEVQLVLRSN
jgi:hypothetical protein